MKTRVNLKYFASFCAWNVLFHSNSSWTPSNIISLTFFDNSKEFQTLNQKLEQLSSETVLKVSLLGNCFPHLFTNCEI